MKLPKDRIPYSAIVDRPPLKLPGDARIAVWTIVNVEEWSIERNMPRTVLPPPFGQPLLPDFGSAANDFRHRFASRAAGRHQRDPAGEVQPIGGGCVHAGTVTQRPRP